MLLYPKRIVSILINKLIIAIKETEVKNIAIAGGVASNKFFRKEVKNLEKNLKSEVFLLKYNILQIMQL